MKRKAQIVATLPEHVANKILSRSGYLDVTKSEYLAMIAKWWFAQGCPFISEEEEVLHDVIQETGDHSLRPAAKVKKSSK